MKKSICGWVFLSFFLLFSNKTFAASKGDAMAVFNAFIDGGRAIRLHAHQAMGAPADGDTRVAIRPFVQFYDGRHYCQSDWHLLLLAIFDGPSSDFPDMSVQDVKVEMTEVEEVFLLDGVRVETMRTPVKRFNNPAGFGLYEAWGFQEGYLLAPEDLGPGAHTFEADVTFMGSTDVAGPITFFIDGPNSGICLQ